MAFNILSIITRFPYAIIAIALLLVEVCIALFIKQPFIRGFLGDVLVVILIYASARAIVQKQVCYLAEVVLVFAVIVEVLQFVNIVQILQIESKLFKVVLGSVFDWFDIIGYVLGYLICKLIRSLQ